MIIEQQPIYLLDKNPPGWVDSSLPQFHTSLLNGSDKPSPEQLLHQSEQRWQEVSGVPVEQSAFTVVLPLHNETNFLPSVLGSIMLSDIPPGVQMNVVFVTNNCKDQTPQMVQEFMGSLGEVSEQDTASLGLEYQDEGLHPQYQTVIPEGTNWHMMHMYSQTGSKANALNVGNEVAKRQGHQVAMCLDGNTLPEPRAIASLFGTAHAEVVIKEDGSPVISGYFKDHQTDHETVEGKTARQLYPSYLGDKINGSSNVVGAMMAWDTDWLSEIGNFPLITLEDGYLGKLLMMNGKDVAYAPEAHTWRYLGGMESRKIQLARFVQGAFQMMDVCPAMEPIIYQTMFYMRGKDERDALLRANAERIGISPEMVDQIIQDYDEIYEMGVGLYKTGNITWEGIEGTK